MAAIRARHPRLLHLGDTPTIVGHKCTVCARVAFPPDPYGCEQCGAVVDRLAEVELAPRGVISSLATVHRHHRPEPEVPFTVATIVLDDGVALKGVLTGDEPAVVGGRVEGVTVPWSTDDDGTEVVDLRFRAVAATSEVAR